MTDDDTSSRELDELCVAYALGALDEPARAALEARAAAEPDVAARLRRYSTAASALGAGDGADLDPAPVRRAGLLGRARRQRPPDRSLLAPAELPSLGDIHRRQSVALSSLVSGLTDRDLARPTRLGQPVGAVLAHLVGQLERTATALGDGTFVEPPAGQYEHWTATEPYVEIHAGVGAVPLDAVLADVNRRIVARLDALAGGPVRLDTPLGQALVKTFELWMHADDVRLALGRPVSVPDHGTLHVVCDLAVGALPVTLALSGTPHPDAVARVVLTGAGGGVRRVALAPDAVDDGREPAVTVVAEGHRFCRLFHRQLTIVEADVEVTGDATVAADLVAAIGVLAENT